MEPYIGNSRAYMQGYPIVSSPSSTFGRVLPSPRSSMYPESSSPRVPPAHGPPSLHAQPHRNAGVDLYPPAQSSRQYDQISLNRGPNSYYYPQQDQLHSLSSVPKHSRPPDIKVENRGIPRSLEVTRVGPAHMFSSIAPTENTQIIVSKPNMAHSVMTSSASHHRPDGRYASVHSSARATQRKGNMHNSLPGSQTMSKSYHPYQQGMSSKSSSSHNPPLLIKAEEPTTLSVASTSHPTASRYKNLPRQIETATAPIPYALAKEAEDPNFNDQLEKSFAHIRRVENPWAINKANQESSLNRKHSPEGMAIKKERNESYPHSNLRKKLPLVNGLRDSQFAVKNENRGSEFDSALDLSVKTIRQTADSTAPEPDSSPINYSDSHPKNLTTGANLAKSIPHEMQQQQPSYFYKEKGWTGAMNPSSHYQHIPVTSSEALLSQFPSSKGDPYYSGSRGHQMVSPGYGNHSGSVCESNNTTNLKGHPANPHKRPNDSSYNASTKFQKVDASGKRRSPYPGGSLPNSPYADPARGSIPTQSFSKDLYKNWAATYGSLKGEPSKEFYITKHENPASYGPEYHEKTSHLTKHLSSSSNLTPSAYYSSSIPQSSSHSQANLKSSTSYPTSNNEYPKSHPAYYNYDNAVSPHISSQKFGYYGPEIKEPDSPHYLKPSVSVSVVSESKPNKTILHKDTFQDFLPPASSPYYTDRTSHTQAKSYPENYKHENRVLHSEQRTPLEEFSEGFNKKLDVVDPKYFQFQGSTDASKLKTVSDAQPPTIPHSMGFQATTQARNPFEDFHDDLYYSNRSTYSTSSNHSTKVTQASASQQEIPRNKSFQLIKATSPEPFCCDEMPSLIKITENDAELDSQHLYVANPSQKSISDSVSPNQDLPQEISSRSGLHKVTPPPLQSEKDNARVSDCVKKGYSTLSEVSDNSRLKTLPSKSDVEVYEEVCPNQVKLDSHATLPPHNDLKNNKIGCIGIISEESSSSKDEIPSEKAKLVSDCEKVDVNSTNAGSKECGFSSSIKQESKVNVPDLTSESDKKGLTNDIQNDRSPEALTKKNIEKTVADADTSLRETGEKNICCSDIKPLMEESLKEEMDSALTQKCPSSQSPNENQSKELSCDSLLSKDSLQTCQIDLPKKIGDSSKGGDGCKAEDLISNEGEDKIVKSSNTEIPDKDSMPGVIPPEICKKESSNSPSSADDIKETSLKALVEAKPRHAFKDDGAIAHKDNEDNSKEETNTPHDDKIKNESESLQNEKIECTNSSVCKSDPEFEQPAGENKSDFTSSPPKDESAAESHDFEVKPRNASSPKTLSSNIENKEPPPLIPYEDKAKLAQKEPKPIVESVAECPSERKEPESLATTSPKDLGTVSKNESQNQTKTDNENALSLVCKPEVARLTLRTDLLEPTNESKPETDLSADKSISAAFQEASKAVSSTTQFQARPAYPKDSLMAQSPWKSVMPFSIPPDNCRPNATIGKSGTQKESPSGNSHTDPSKFTHPAQPPQSPYSSRPASSHSVPPYSSPSLMPPPSHSAPLQSGQVNSKTTHPEPPSHFQSRTEPNSALHKNSQLRNIHPGSVPQPSTPCLPVSPQSLQPSSIVKSEPQNYPSLNHTSKIAITSPTTTVPPSSSFSYSTLYAHYASHSEVSPKYPAEIVAAKQGVNHLPSIPSRQSDSYQTVRSPHSPLHPPPDDPYSYKGPPYPRSPSYPPGPPHAHYQTYPYTTESISSDSLSSKTSYLPYEDAKSHNQKEVPSYSLNKEAISQHVSNYGANMVSSYSANHHIIPQGHKDHFAQESRHQNANIPVQGQHLQHYPPNYMQEHIPNHPRDSRAFPEQQKKEQPRIHNSQYKEPSPVVSYAGPYATSDYAKYSSGKPEQQPQGSARPHGQPTQAHHYQSTAHASPSAYSSHQASPHPQNYPPLAHSQKKTSSSFQGHPPKAAHSQTHSPQVCQSPSPAFPRPLSASNAGPGHGGRSIPAFPFSHPQVNEQHGYSDSVRGAAFSPNQIHYVSPTPRSLSASPRSSKNKTPLSNHTSSSPSPNLSPHPAHRIPTPGHESSPSRSNPQQGFHPPHQQPYMKKPQANPPPEVGLRGTPEHYPNFKRANEGAKEVKPFAHSNNYPVSSSQYALPPNSHYPTTSSIYSDPKGASYPHYPPNYAFPPSSASGSGYNDCRSSQSCQPKAYQQQVSSSSNKFQSCHYTPTTQSHPQIHSSTHSDSLLYSAQSYNPNTPYAHSQKTLPPPKQAHSSSIYQSTTHGYSYHTTTTTTTSAAISNKNSYTDPYSSSQSYHQQPYSYSAQSYPSNTHSYQNAPNYSLNHTPTSTTSSYQPVTHPHSYVGNSYLSSTSQSERSVPYKHDYSAPVEKSYSSNMTQLPTEYKSPYSIPVSAENQVCSNTTSYTGSDRVQSVPHNQYEKKMHPNLSRPFPSTSINTSYGDSLSTGSYNSNPANRSIKEERKFKENRPSGRTLPFPSKHPAFKNSNTVPHIHEQNLRPLSNLNNGGFIKHESGTLLPAKDGKGIDARNAIAAVRKGPPIDHAVSKKGLPDESTKPVADKKDFSQILSVDEFSTKFDNFLEDLASHSEFLTSKKSRYLGKRYYQKVQLQQAVDNKEIILPEPVLEESEESEPEMPVKFRGKFKSIKDKAVERVILTYASHSDESATEMIPDEDASDFEEELIKEIEAKSRKGRKGKAKPRPPLGTTHTKCPLKVQRLKLLTKEEKEKKDGSDFVLSSSDSESSSGYSMTRSSSDSSESCGDSDDSIASASSESKSSQNRKKSAKRKVRLEDTSYSEDESFVPHTRMRSKSSKRPKGKQFKRKRKRSLDSDSDEVKRSSKKRLKNKFTSAKKREGYQDDSESEDLTNLKNRKKAIMKKFAKRNAILSSESDDDVPSKSETDSSRRLVEDLKETSLEKVKPELEAKEEEPKKLQEMDEVAILKIDYNSLVDVDDSLVIKIHKQREEECHRDDVLEMTAWRDEVSQEMLKLLAELPETHWRQSWKKPTFGQDFYEGWQKEFKQFKIETSRTPKVLVSIPPIPTPQAIKKFKRIAKDINNSTSKSSRSPSPVKNTRSKSGIVKTSLNVSNKSNCKVATRPEIGSVMQNFFEKVMGSPSIIEQNRNLFAKKLTPNPFSFYGKPRTPTGLTPTPSVAPYMMASDDSDRDSLASLRADLPASDIVPITRKHSITNTLMKRLKKKYSEPKVNTQWLNKPRSILEATNKPQLLPTPGLTIKSTSGDSRKLSLLFRKDSVNKYKETFDEIIAKNENNVFTPILAPSRTRTKSRAILDAASIKAVFGEDLPVKEEVQEKVTKLKKKPLVKLEELIIPAPSPIPSSVSHSSTPVDFLFQNADEEYDSELRSERSSSVLGEFSIMQVGQQSRKKLRKYRKFRSGFDYIRKKKKVRPDEDVISTAKRKVPTRKKVLWPEATDVATEVRTWVTNKGLGETILHKAARLQYHDVVVHCLETGDFDVNVRDNAKYTPLHEACNRGHLDIAQALCAHGALLNAPGYGGKRPLHEAIENGFPELARLLLTYGADPSLSTYAGQSCLSLTNESSCASFLKNYLGDLKGEKVEACVIPGPALCTDLQEQGSDFFSGLCKSREGGSDLVQKESRHDALLLEKTPSTDLTFESCERELPPTFRIDDSPTQYMLQSDLLEFFGMTREELVIAVGSIQTVSLSAEKFSLSVHSCIVGYNSPASLLDLNEIILVKCTEKLQKFLDVNVDIVS